MPTNAITPAPSQVFFEEMMSRSGLRHCGGNMTHFPADRWNGGSEAWANRFVGLFVVDNGQSEVVDVDAFALRDVIACGVVLNDTSTSVVVGKREFEAQGFGLTTVYLPCGERFRFATRSAVGLKSVTMVLDLRSFADQYGLSVAQLPCSLQKMIGRREPAVEHIAPSNLFMRVVEDIGSKRGMFPSLPSLYLEAKAGELISAWLRQLAQRDGHESENRVIDPRTLDGIARVKHIIERNPHMPLNIDALAAGAAMNRTKLRSAFKEVYGLTLSDYRASLLMHRAEGYLREPGVTVQEAAYRAGYTTASSFIVAYKRFFGVSPGDLKRR